LRDLKQKTIQKQKAISLERKKNMPLREIKEKPMKVSKMEMRCIFSKIEPLERDSVIK